jgi:hypothetical protein
VRGAITIGKTGNLVMKGFLSQAIAALLITFCVAWSSFSKAKVNSSSSSFVKPTIDRTDRTENILPQVEHPVNKNLATATTADEKRFQALVKDAIARDLPEKPLPTILQSVAEQFLGASYQAGLLDKSDREVLFVSLEKFDCVLFVETVLAISNNIATKKYQYQDLKTNLIERRYRNGTIDGYCSRLHYFSDWIDDNQKRSNVKDITADLGGVPLNKKLNFMSSHRQLYPHLAKNDSNYQCIVNVEKHLNQLDIRYIPTHKVKQIYNRLQPGDIIAIATEIPGLDVTHTGLVYRDRQENIGLIHASPIGRVTVAKDLHRYVNKVGNAIGIFVVRPVLPKS